mmetsp:Transcript_5086/g.13064  ORF Transcript_5086/g.13064 Transcript_5086/m.13064 type:complete len:83 (+) Transcript_5086:653-901(+)
MIEVEQLADPQPGCTGADVVAFGPSFGRFGANVVVGLVAPQRSAHQGHETRNQQQRRPAKAPQSQGHKDDDCGEHVHAACYT